MNTLSIRFLQKLLLHLRENIIFKTSHISLWGKITLFWVFLCMISLFINWGWTFWNIIDARNVENIHFNSFSLVMWYIWYFIFIWLLIISFAICSIKKKQKFKYLSLIEIRDYSSAIIIALMIFLSTLHSYFLTKWLQLFSSNISHWNWVILCMTGAIIIFIWGVWIRWEHRSNIKWSYINNTSKYSWEKDISETKNNMKLPF